MTTCFAEYFYYLLGLYPFMKQEAMLARVTWQETGQPPPNRWLGMKSGLQPTAHKIKPSILKPAKN